VSDMFEHLQYVNRVTQEQISSVTHLDPIQSRLDLLTEEFCILLERREMALGVLVHETSPNASEQRLDMTIQLPEYVVRS
jgi:hypothetical protein